MNMEKQFTESLIESEQNLEYVSDSETSTVNGEDLDYILSGNKKLTWDDFYEMLELERASGNENCPQAAYIALELLKNNLLQLSWRSVRTNSETHKDLLQNAYITIVEHIPAFDKSQANFKTFIMKWLHGLARETRSDGVSNYQQKKMEVRVYSSDALVAKGGTDEYGDCVVEFADENSAVEDVVERKNKARSNELMKQILKEDCDAEEVPERKDVYTNAVFCQLFLGGIENFSDEMKEEVESML